jgi:hypothetical protein
MKGDEYMRYVDNVNKEKPKKESREAKLETDSGFEKSEL